MKNQETEVKFKLGDEKSLVNNITEMGFVKVKEVFETNLIFDMKDSSYSSMGRLIRVRMTDKGNILTYKEKQGEDTVYKVRTEIETGIDDSEQMIEMLKYMGFIITFVYQKRRKYYKKDNIEITVDELPFGKYIEMESTREEIDILSKKLNLELTEISNMSYLDLYESICEEDGIESSSITAFTDEDYSKYEKLIKELNNFQKNRF